ncbi:hypothetical protein LTR15_011125 [Elasticomyces elasticus]|nr:hypothetical protein LTR15_011125 [Elasticomyces elasticus]
MASTHINRTTRASTRRQSQRNTAADTNSASSMLSISQTVSQASSDNIALDTTELIVPGNGELAETQLSPAQMAVVTRVIEDAHRRGIEQGRREQEQKGAATYQQTGLSGHQETVVAREQEKGTLRNSANSNASSHVLPASAVINDPASEPQQAVFSIPELFDMVMQHVDLSQLFVNLRVTGTWNTYLSRSKALQQRMFLCPISITTDPSLVKVNPIAAHLVEHFYKIPEGSAWARSEASWRKMLLVNPVAARHTINTHLYLRSGEVGLVDSVNGDERYRSMTLTGLANALDRMSKHKYWRTKLITEMTVTSGTCGDTLGGTQSILCTLPLPDVQVPAPTLSLEDERRQKLRDTAPHRWRSTRGGTVYDPIWL